MLGADQGSPGIDGEFDGDDAQQQVVDGLKEVPKVISDDQNYQSGSNRPKKYTSPKRATKELFDSQNQASKVYQTCNILSKGFFAEIK